jgi:hypothetical protein
MRSHVLLDADRDGHGTVAGTPRIAADGHCDTSQQEATSSDDCDDTDPTRFPGATEIVGDGIDQDCSGFDSVHCFVDADADGFGGTIVIVAVDGDCSDPGESAVGTDCNDGNPAIHPGAPEIPLDGIDQDCNGGDLTTCYVDGDGDGFGGITPIAPGPSGCAEPGKSPFNTDCNDANAGIYPGANEIVGDGIDQNCNGADTISCIVDADRDGFGTSVGTVILAADGHCDTAQGEAAVGGDCNDASALVFPGANDVPGDGIDQNCNGVDAVTCFVDADHDGFGGPTTIVAQDGDCNDVGESTVGTDCADNDLSRYPGASEIQNDGIDQDCNGFDTITCIRDVDQDGYGTAAGTIVPAADGHCDTAQQESGTSNDCNDADATIHPGATDIPNDGIDQNCDGSDVATCFVDGDLDGFGGTTPAVIGQNPCTGSGVSTLNTDCNDAVATIYPGASEVPDDGIDQNCNGTDTVTCFVDGDQDGYGTSVGTTTLAADGTCNSRAAGILHERRLQRRKPPHSPRSDGDPERRHRPGLLGRRSADLLRRRRSRRIRRHDDGAAGCGELLRFGSVVLQYGLQRCRRRDPSGGHRHARGRHRSRLQRSRHGELHRRCGPRRLRHHRGNRRLGSRRDLRREPGGSFGRRRLRRRRLRHASDGYRAVRRERQHVLRFCSRQRARSGRRRLRGVLRLRRHARGQPQHLRRGRLRSRRRRHLPRRGGARVVSNGVHAGQGSRRFRRSHAAGGRDGRNRLRRSNGFGFRHVPRVPAQIEAPLNCMKDADDDGYGDVSVVLPVVPRLRLRRQRPIPAPGSAGDLRGRYRQQLRWIGPGLRVALLASPDEKERQSARAARTETPVRLLAAVLALFAFGAPGPCLAGTAKGLRVRLHQGRIADPYEKAPLGNATVRLTAQDARVFEAVTNRNGVFVFERLPVATFALDIVTEDGKLVSWLQSDESPDPDHPRVKVKFARKRGASTVTVVPDRESNNVAVAVNTPPVRWGRFWKQFAIFAGAAVILSR